MRTFRLLLLTIAALACSEQQSTQTPNLTIEPDSFVFPKLTVGESRQSEVVVSNSGTGTLILRSIDLNDESTAGEFTLQRKDGDDLSEVEAPVSLEQGDRLVLVVTYAPADDNERPDRGSVGLETNDAARLSVNIPIGGEDQGAEIVVSPEVIDFGAVTAGERAERTLTITNIGVADLVVDHLTRNGSPDFTIERQGAVLPDDLSDEPIVIPPLESRDLDVIYAPETAGPDGAEVHIQSNDPIQPDVTVLLTANGAAACVRVVPDNLDFGASLKVENSSPETPTPNVESILVESCGGTPLQVTAIEITGGDAEFFHLPPAQFGEERPEGQPLINLPALTPGQPAPSQPLTVEFRPTEERVYGARVVLHTNAVPDTTEVVLFGRGVENSCPIPTSRSESYNVRPLDVITLDGSPSTDPGGEVAEWHWTVISRPEGSTAGIVERFHDPNHPADGGEPDDVTTPEAFFFVDLAGEYEFELVVVDNLGQESCEPLATARVTVSAVPDKDLHVQLVWTTPDDPDETDDTGTDVDLHLRHPMADGGWNTDAGIYDCYFANKTPDWGVPLDPADNPTLDIDDTNGAGPENINLARPEPVGYDIAALYFRAESALGDPDPTIEHLSLVSLRIYVRGELLWEQLDKELEHRADLWHAATVRWCEDLATCPEITTVDEVLTEAEYDRP